MPESLFREIFVKKQLVLDVCEPYIQTINVSFNDCSFCLQRFGSFEFNGDEFIYGCEENNYNSLFDKENITALPVIFAICSKDENGERTYTLYPAGNFSQDEIDAIVDEIEYTLESQRVAALYMTRCTG